MVKRTSLTIISLIAFLIIPFISLNSYAEETEVAAGIAKITDPSNTGAAGTSIAIQVPPGRKGISPNVALGYGSNSGNGLAGVGWGFGLGEIQRSTKKGVNYNGNDYIFIGSGMVSELVPRPDWGANYYGAKIEGAFNKFFYNSSAGSWEVTDKAGTKYYYGTTSSSKQENTYGTFKWVLDRVQDINGNYMTVSYLKDQGEIYVDRIDYTGNTAGLSPSNYVKFYWESRLDVVPIYASNSLVKTAYRLKTIDVNGNGQRARAYTFTYTQSSNTNRSLLTSAQMYGNDATLDANGTITGGSALPATQFTYSSDSKSFTSTELLISFGNGDPHRFKTVDFNGDGKVDIGYVDSSATIHVALSTNSGFSAPSMWSSVFGNGDYARYFFGDFNSDGKVDVSYLTLEGALFVALSTGSGFTNFTEWLAPLGDGDPARYKYADFNNDGRFDLAYVDSAGNISVALLTENSFSIPSLWLSAFGDGTPSRYYFADFNGDGKADVAFLSVTENGGTFYVSLSNGSGFSVPTQWIGPYGNGYPAFYRFIDFNGDAKTDVVFIAGTGALFVALSNGKTLEPVAQWVAYGDGDPTRYYFADFNGDGKSDVAFLHMLGGYTGALSVLLSNGSGFSDSAGWSSEAFGDSDPARYVNADFNGDNKSDITFLTAQGTFYGGFSGTPGAVADLLTGISNGIGGTTAITYKPSSEYTNTLLPFVVQTVSSITNNDGNGNISTTNFTYSGGYFDVDEREFRGFSYQKSTNPISTTVETWFYQDNLFKGTPHEQIVKDVYGNTYTRTFNTYDSVSLYTGVTFPYLAQKDDYTYDGAQTYRQTTVSFEYDSYGNTTRKYLFGNTAVSGDEVDNITIYNYDTQNWILSNPAHTYVTDSNGIIKAQTRFTYDSKGNRLSQINWLENGSSPVTSYTYDVYGNPKTTTDPKNNISTISYDSSYTYPVSMANALGHSGYISYDFRIGKPIAKTDANGNTATFEYDVFGRLIESTDPGTSASAYMWKETYYDGFGRTIKTKAPGPDGKTIVAQKVYNSTGLVSAASFPYFEGIETPRWTYFTYDPIGRTIQVTNPDGTTVKSSYMQGRITNINANGHVKIEERDIYARLVKVEEYTGIYPSVNLYATTTYEYDILGNLLKTTDTKGNQTTLAYDTLGRKTQMIDPDMGHWQYAYDANGNLTSQTDAKGQTITFTYDALNRIKTKHYPTGPDVVYTYDETTTPNSKGKLTTVTDATGQEKYYYDQLGRTTTFIKTIDGIQYVTENTYDSLGRTTSVKYPDGETINYSYDAAGNLVQVPGYVTYSNFNALGQASLITYANGVTTQYQYQTDNNRLYSITTNSPISGGLQNLSYNYDNRGNIITITDVMDNTRTQNFTYDDLNRLTQAQSTSYNTLTYNYDQIGNMTYNSQMGSYIYGTKPHAVIQAGTNTYTYDANGNMITRPGQTITYDYDNKPIAINATTFVYDYSGSRIKKNNTVYIGKGYECTNGDCTKYIFAGSNRIASKTASTTYYYHTDHLGSSSIITDSSGAKTEETYYYPYGGTRQHTGSTNLKHKYTGQEEDPETGLYYYGARYYDPALARFISADTIVPYFSDPQSFNRYSYAGNNPIIYTDPTGHVIGIDDAIIIGIAIGAAAGAVSAGIQSGWDFDAMFQGAVIGGAIGGVTGGVSMGVGQLAGSQVIGGIVGGAVGGAIGAMASEDGKIGKAMLIGGIVGGIGAGIGASVKSVDPSVAASIQISSAAILGGIISELNGGSFSQGAIIAAASAAASIALGDKLAKVKGRPLTADEIAKARKAFKDKIDYSKVLVVDGKFHVFQGDNIMSPDGNIYWPGECGNLAVCGGQKVADYFIHEMTHVMQVQQGQNVLLSGFFLHALRIITFGFYNPYSYTPGQPFNSYNIEQQAVIAEKTWAEQAAGY